MRVVGRVASVYDRVESDLVRHLKTFFLIVGNFRRAVWDADRCRHFSLEFPEFHTLSIRGKRITDLLIGYVSNILLGVKAFRSVKLHLESLSFLRHPSGIDTFVLLVSPGVLAEIHLVPAALQ